jgi:hypothetical protein
VGVDIVGWMFQCVKMINFSKYTYDYGRVTSERLLCRDNEYRHSLIYDLIMTTSFWKKDSLLAALDFKCLDMSAKGALYRFHYWNKVVPIRLPENKAKARAVLQRIGKKPLEVRMSNGSRKGEPSRADMENEMMRAEGWFDTTITHNVHVPQLDSIMGALTSMVEKLDVPTTVMDTLIQSIVNLTLLCKIDLKDWVAVSAWAMNALMSLGVKTTQVLGFLSKFKFQSETQLEAQGLTNFSWVQFLCSFFSIGIFKTELPKEAMLAITKIGGSARGIMNIWQLIEKIVKDGIPLIYKFVVGVPYEVSQLEAYFDDIREWYDEVNRVVTVGTLDEIAVNLDKCKEIENLFRKGMTYMSRAEEMRMDPKMVRTIEFHFNVLKVFYDKVQASGAFKCSPRVEPLVVAVTGDPGVGKSGMMFPLAIEILKACGLDKNEMKKWASHIYTRNVNQGHWDGFNDHLICMYDDFGQKRDTVAAPNEEFMEVIKTANLAPYNLNMAALSEKARTYFRSKAIILNSNTSYFNPQSITHPEAVRRRIDIMAQVCVRPEFRLAGTPRIDREKVRKAFPQGFTTEIYQMWLLDPLTGHHARRDPISYDEFLARALYKFNDKIKGSEEQLAYLNNLAAQGDCAPDIESWTEDSWLAAFEAYQDGDCQAFPEFREDLISLTGFKIWLHGNLDNVNWDILREMHKNPMLRAMDHYASRLFGRQIVLSQEVKFFVEKSKQCVMDFFERAKSFTARAIEMIKKYPLITALMVAVPFVGACWWASQESPEEEARRQMIVRLNGMTEEELNNPATFAEVSQSGDYKTAKKAMKTEIGQSGDYKTSKAKMKVEASQSGDYKTVRKAMKTELLAQGYHAELQEDQNAFNLAKKLYANSYFIDILKDDVRIGRMRGIFVRGRTFLTARHLLPTLRRGTHVWLHNSKKKEGFLVPIERLQVVEVRDRQGDLKDQILIDMSVLVHDHPDVLGSVATSEEMSRFQKSKAVLITPDEDNVIFRYGDAHSRDIERSYESSDAVYKIRKHYEYSLETGRGDCGSPLVAISTLLARKLIGIHVAGGKGIGVATPLNQDDIRESMKKLGEDAEVILDAQDWVVDLKFPEELKLPDGDFTALGVAQYVEGANSKTDIEPSVIHGYVEPSTKPCYLRPIQVNGKEVDPMMNGLKKCAKPSSALNENFLKAAVNDVRRNFPRDKERQRVLTNYEAMAGVEGDAFATPLKLSTSAGYPWKKQSKKPGKTEWCGKDGNYVMHPDLEKALSDREEKARNNARYPTIWVDTLKDERRPIAKVDQGKTRVFSAGPVDYIVASRKYFLGFAAHVAANRNRNEISVGTNVYSTDWDVIATIMQEKGKNVIAGDFSNFDGTLNVEILHAICDIINDWYDDGEENQRIRRILWRETVNSIHVCKDSIYMWTHSQPSGNALTAILNSMYNAIACRYVWMVVTQKETSLHSMKAFRENVNMVSYGDDNLLNVSDEVIDIFNQLTMAEAFATFGMTYTDEAKSGSMVKCRTLDQVGYLKRNFVFDEAMHSWKAPLDLDTVLEIPNWVRRSPDIEEATVSNIEDATAELSLHGEEIFDKWSKVLTRVAREHGLEPKILTYYEYVNCERFVKGALSAFA